MVSSSIYLILLAEIKYLAGISEILNKLSWKIVNSLTAYVNLGERSKYNYVMFKRADWGFWGTREEFLNTGIALFLEY